MFLHLSVILLTGVSLPVSVQGGLLSIGVSVGGGGLCLWGYLYSGIPVQGVSVKEIEI